MFGWDVTKKYFYAWEGATAQYLEAWLKSPLVLEPAGAWLSSVMKVKRAGDKAAANMWAPSGLRRSGIRSALSTR